MGLGLQLQRRWWRTRSTHPALTRLLSEPIYKKPFAQTRYVAIDLETTALEPDQGEIASIGWVTIENAQVQLDQAGYYPISLNNDVGQSAIYHQLTDTDLANGYPLEQALNQLMNALSNSVLLFHNASLDMGFINYYLRRHWGAPLLMPVEDTLLREKNKLERSHTPIKTGDLRLFQCRKRYGLPDVELHDAFGDALATAELWLAINSS